MAPRCHALRLPCINDFPRQVEEFMLLANIAVAEKIVKTFPRYAMLRRHPVPSRRRFDPLVAAAEAVGVELDVSSSKVCVFVCLCLCVCVCVGGWGAHMQRPRALCLAFALPCCPPALL
jgi:hypothetical protein